MSDELVRLQIDGLPQLRSYLRSLDPALSKGMQRANRAAADTIAAAARSRYDDIYNSNTHQHEQAIRSRATQTSATVVLTETRKGSGGLFGQEFGSYQAPGRHQFKEYVPSDTGKGGAGYFFFPAVRAEVPNLILTYSDMLRDALEAVL